METELVTERAAQTVHERLRGSVRRIRWLWRDADNGADDKYPPLSA